MSTQTPLSQLPTPGYYRHFKGNIYHVEGIAQHSETLEPMVIYRAMYGEKKLWIRPSSMWSEHVEKDGYSGPRFAPLRFEDLPDKIRRHYVPDLHRLEQIIQWSKEHTKASPLHGEVHWHRVGKNGRLLCDDQDLLVAQGLETEHPNRKVVTYFAYLHDSCRLDDGYDTEHGPRAAETICEIRSTLLSDLTDEEFLLLQRAIREHTSSPTTDNITINICLDSDRLDLGRVGVKPDPARMASYVGSLRANILE